MSLSFSTRPLAGLVLAVTALVGLSFGSSLAQAETEREYCERQQGAVRTVCLRELDKTGAAAASASQSATAPSSSSAADAAQAERAYCERQLGAVRAVCLRELAKKSQAGSAPTAAAPTAPEPATAAAPKRPAAAAKDAAAGPLYTVRNGTQVDAATYQGFRTWRSAACDRCHGANQEGMVGPSLIASLKLLSKAEFRTVLMEGRLMKGMPSFANHKGVVEHLDGLYAYLKGRSDGAITSAHVKPMASR